MSPEEAKEARELKIAAALERAEDNRAKLIARLEDEGESELATTLSNCGLPLALLCSCCGMKKLVKTACKRKWCPVCVRRIAAARVGKYEAAVLSMQWPIFLTLTVPNIETIDPHDVRKMRRAFAKMREQKWWMKAVKGGVISVEVTNIGNGWHPHLHCVLDCKWLSVTEPGPKPFESRASLLARFERAAKEIAARWAKAMKLPEARIKIKRAYAKNTSPEIPQGSQSIAREVLKYSVKTGDLLKCVEPIGSLIRTLDACRLVSSVGTCYGKNLTLGDDLRTMPECPQCHATRSMIPEEVVRKMISRTRDDCRKKGENWK